MLILASNSPRRRELLRVITPQFTVLAKATSEEVPDDMPPERAVEELALRKAWSVALENPRDTVIGADTMVVLDGVAMGKPADEEDAARMLRALSGRRHFVYTGVAVVTPGNRVVFHEQTAVQFTQLDDERIRAYVASGEPMDKAGAYGIQGGGALFISRIDGDYYNVMGLPLCRLAGELRQLGVMG